MGFKSPRAMVNAIIKAKSDPIESEIKKAMGQSKLLFSKIQKYAKKQTDEQSKASRKIMQEYFEAVDGAEKALKLTKAQLMISHMERQLAVYEKA